MNEAGTVIKKLSSPWSVGGHQVNDIEIRAPLLGDMIEAEKEAHPGVAPYAYRVALACRQMVRAGTFTGPFVVGQFRSMKPSQWAAVTEAMEEAEKLGEDEQPGTRPNP